jgi:methylglyoxal synthase
MNKKIIVLVAHDARKTDILEWADFNLGTLKSFEIYATQTTGQILRNKLGLDINLLKSGPLGGDAQVATMIVEGKTDILIFFWDPLTPQPHDVDVKALLRLAVLYNIPIACNRSTADYIISSPLINSEQRSYSTSEPL